MTAVRPLLACLFAAAASTGWSAPAPLPRPNRPEEAAVERLKRELGERGVYVIGVEATGRGAWAVTFLDWRRPGCVRGKADVDRLRRRRVIPALARSAALRRLLEDIREADRGERGGLRQPD